MTKNCNFVCRNSSPEVVYHLKFEMFISEMSFARLLFYLCKYFEDFCFIKALLKSTVSLSS